MSYSINRTIGKELRLAREGHGMQVRAYAKEIGVSSTYISEIERFSKVPSEEIIEKIADVYAFDRTRLYKGFSVVPDVMLRELCSPNHKIFDMIFHLSEDDTISNEEKEEFFEEVHSLYKKHFTN